MRENISVMQFLPRLDEGGVERGTVEMNREFCKAEMNSTVVSAGGKMVPSISRDGGRHILFDVCSKNLFTVPFRVLGLRRILKREMPDIVHARSRVPAWLIYLANKKMGIPFVTTVHGINSINSYSKIMTAGDQVICVGDPVRKHICKNYQTDPDKITVIPRGVDMAYFDPQKTNNEKVKSLKKGWGIENKFVIGSIGRISRVKNFEVVVEAFAKLSLSHPNTAGLIIGGSQDSHDNYAQSLLRYAEKLCPDRIKWTGSINQMREAYECCDIVVNASPLMGNVARTLLESLAMNKPVVSTAMKGLDHVVKDGLNGYTFESDDANSLAMKIRLLIDHRLPEVRRTLPERFTLDSMVRSTIEVYNKALV